MSIEEMQAWLEALRRWRREAQDQNDPILRAAGISACETNERYVLSRLWRSFP